MIVLPFASQNCYCFSTPCAVLGVQFCRGYVNSNSGSFAYIFLFGSQSLTSREKYTVSESETTASPASKISLHRLLLDMKSDMMQHVQDCVSNSMQDCFRDDVPSESCDDHSNPPVSDEIENFLAHDVSQYSGETEASGDLKDLAAKFSTKERTSSSIEDDLLKIIEGVINNQLPKEKIDRLTEKYPRPENCKLLVVPKTNRAVWNQLKDATKKADMGMQKCQKLFMAALCMPF